uniref:TORC_N domain-containing protein n=1 Tax=Globodera pallida TaxID=36090 RepID=A0A183BXE5_GLOPA
MASHMQIHHRQQQPMGGVHGQPFELSAVMARYGGAMPKLPTEKAAGMMASTSQQILPPEHQMGYYEGPPAGMFPSGHTEMMQQQQMVFVGQQQQQPYQQQQPHAGQHPYMPFRGRGYSPMQYRTPDYPQQMAMQSQSNGFIF